MDKGASRGIKKIAGELGGLGGIGGALIGFGKSYSKYVTAPIIGGAVAALKFSADFEQQMSQLKAVLGSEAIPTTMDIIRQKALDMSMGSIFSAQQIALAFTDLAKAGISAKDIMDGAGQAAVVLAHATGGDLTKSADIMAITMNQFQLSGKDAANVADYLTNGANTSAASVASLGQSLSYTGNAAHTLGISLPETIAMLDAMADAGLKGSRTGTNLQAALKSMVNPTQAASAIWDSWNVQLIDAQGNFIGMDKVLQILNSHLKGMGKAERLATLNDLFGVQGGRAMAALLLTQTEAAKKAGKTWEDYKRNVLGSGAALRQSKILLDNLAGSWAKLKNIGRVAMIEIGMIMTPFVRKLVDDLAKLLKIFIRLPAPIKIFITLFLLLFASIGPILMVLGVLLEGFALLASGWVAAAVALGLLVAGLTSAFPGVTKFMGVITKLWTDMQRAFGSHAGIAKLLAGYPEQFQSLVRPLLDVSDAVGDIFRAFTAHGADVGFQVLLDNLGRIASDGISIGAILITGVVNILLTGAGILAGWVSDKALNLLDYIKAGLGLSTTTLGGGTGMSMFPGGGSGTTYAPISDITLKGVVKLLLTLEGGAIATAQSVIDYITTKLFTGHGETHAVPVIFHPKIGFTPLLDSDIVDHNAWFETYRVHIEGLFEGWAKDHHLIFRPVIDHQPQMREFNWSGLGELIKQGIHDVVVKGIHWTLYVGYPIAINWDTGFAIGTLAKSIYNLLFNVKVGPLQGWMLAIGIPILWLGFGWPLVIAGIAGLIVAALMNSTVRARLLRWTILVGIPDALNFDAGFFTGLGVPKAIADAMTVQGGGPISVKDIQWIAIMDQNPLVRVGVFGLGIMSNLATLIKMAMGNVTVDNISWIATMDQYPVIHYAADIAKIVEWIGGQIGDKMTGSNYGVKTSPIDWKAQINNSPSEIIASGGLLAPFYLSYLIGEKIAILVGTVVVPALAISWDIAQATWDALSSEFDKLFALIRDNTPEFIKKLFSGDIAGAINAVIGALGGGDTGGRSGTDVGSGTFGTGGSKVFDPSNVKIWTPTGTITPSGTSGGTDTGGTNPMDSWLPKLFDKTFTKAAQAAEAAIAKVMPGGPIANVVSTTKAVTKVATGSGAGQSAGGAVGGGGVTGGGGGGGGGRIMFNMGNIADKVNKELPQSQKVMDAFVQNWQTGFKNAGISSQDLGLKVGTFAGSFQTNFMNMKNNSSQFSTGAMSDADKMRNSIDNDYVSLRNDIVSIATNLNNQVTNQFVAMEQNMVQIASIARNGVANEFVGLRDDISVIIGSIDAYNPLFNVGFNMGAGLLDGWSSGSAGFSNAVYAIVAEGVAAAKVAAGVKSPSTKMMAISHHMVNGALIPLEKRKGEVHAAIAGLISMPSSGYGPEARFGGGNQYDIDIHIEGGNDTKEEIAKAVWDQMALQLKLKHGL